MAIASPRIHAAKTTRHRSFMAQPFKSPSGMYYIRRKVPEALKTTLGREYKRSLNTRDPSEAKRLFALEWEKSESLFALARAQNAGAITLPQRDMRILAERWFESELAKMEASGDFSVWLAEGGQVTWEQGNCYREHTSMISLQDAINDNPEDEALIDTADLVRKALREQNIPMPAQGTPELESLVHLFRVQWLKDTLNKWSDFQRRFLVFHQVEFNSVLVQI